MDTTHTCTGISCQINQFTGFLTLSNKDKTFPFFHHLIHFWTFLKPLKLSMATIDSNVCLHQIKYYVLKLLKLLHSDIIFVASNSTPSMSMHPPNNAHTELCMDIYTHAHIYLQEMIIKIELLITDIAIFVFTLMFNSGKLYVSKFRKN